MQSCLKHTPWWWRRETLPTTWKISQYGWVLVCALQSFLCIGVQLCGPQPQGTQLEKEGINGRGMCLYTVLVPMGKHTVLHYPWVWSTAWPCPHRLRTEERRRRKESEQRRKERRRRLLPTDLSYIPHQHIMGAVPVAIWQSQMHKIEQLFSWLFLYLPLTQARWF